MAAEVAEVAGVGGAEEEGGQKTTSDADRRQAAARANGGRAREYQRTESENGRGAGHENSVATRTEFVGQNIVALPLLSRTGGYTDEKYSVIDANADQQGHPNDVERVEAFAQHMHRSQ